MENNQQKTNHQAQQQPFSFWNTQNFNPFGLMSLICNFRTTDGSFIKIELIEGDCDKDHFTKVWPSAYYLSAYLMLNKSRFSSRKMLEIGSGCGLVGILATKIGLDCIMSEGNSLAVDRLRRMCRMNDLDPAIKRISWHELSEDLFSLPKIDVLLGSDLFFSSKDFCGLLWFIAFLLEYNNSNMEVHMAIELRSTNKREHLNYLLCEQQQQQQRFFRDRQYRWELIDVDEIAEILDDSLKKHDVLILRGFK